MTFRSSCSVTATAMALLSGCSLTNGAPAGDLVPQVPGFAKASFQTYSGMLDVPGPVAGYDKLSIHYQFHESQRDPTNDPLVLWHTGGPGGSSIDVGLYTEMGYYQLDSKGAHSNPFAWNAVANMLYLEAPAGSGRSSGFSMCYKNDKPVTCSWNDISQAEAYAHTIAAFLKAFPELTKNDLFLVGESYFGQYGPNIAHYILNTAPFNETFNLKGMALGNACWGGNETYVTCNGYNSHQNDLDLYFGKGLMSRNAYETAYEECNFTPDLSPTGPGSLSEKCERALDEAFKQPGPHNVYDIYDNCPRTAKYMERNGLTMRQMLAEARSTMNSGGNDLDSVSQSSLGGGYEWSCGGEDAAANWFLRKDVQEAMHLPKPAQSDFEYQRSGPASVTLYPSLIGRIRIMIYNGDADSCVPYKGNSEWIAQLEGTGLYSQKDEWRPWYAQNVTYMPAGYVTTYIVKDSDLDFSYATVRLAGHMVPTFMPNAALTLLSRFLAHEPL